MTCAPGMFDTGECQTKGRVQGKTKRTFVNVVTGVGLLQKLYVEG